MSATSACIARVSAADYVPHPLHATSRVWPESNCHVDLWIEVLSALDLPPEAVLGVTASIDFEGDQFTFYKIPPEDLAQAFGLKVMELSIYDPPAEHIALQIDRGRLALMEVDAIWLPDTEGVTYRREHDKTTIAPNRIDLEGRRLEYFHNDGLFALEGEDFDGLFPAGGPPKGSLPPFTELVKLDLRPQPAAELRTWARANLARHCADRPAENPVRAFQAALSGQIETHVHKPFGFFHKYAFHTLRQLGSCFELLADHLAWLAQGRREHEDIARCMRIAECAKAMEFQFARAFTRKRWDGLAQGLNPAADAYDALFEGLASERAA